MSSKSRFIQGAMAVLLTCSVASAMADTLTIPGHFPADMRVDMPSRGMRMEQVINQFGQPDERKPAVGEPPITEWNYGDFRVYFEYDMVLHSLNLNTLIMPQ